MLTIKIVAPQACKCMQHCQIERTDRFEIDFQMRSESRCPELQLVMVPQCVEKEPKALIHNRSSQASMDNARVATDIAASHTR